MNNGQPEVVSFEEGNLPKDLLIHDPTADDASRGFALSRLELNPGMPTPFGIFREKSQPLFTRKASCVSKKAAI